MTHLDAAAFRRRRRRHAYVLLVSLLLGAACGEPTGVGDGNGGQTPSPYSHTLAPGASAHDLLAADDFSHLVVQIQHVDGFAPSSQGLDALQAFLEARLNKPGGITLLSPQALDLSPQATYSSSQIRELERAHRTVYTRGDTLATYLLFLDGEFAAGSNVLGVAYNNTSMAIFEERIVDNTGGPLDPPRATVEATVMHHEFGHLMGLVANGSEMQVEHQDEPNGHHCVNESCLMYFSVRTTDFLANLTGGDVPELDQDCLDDLAANGGR